MITHRCKKFYNIGPREANFFTGTDFTMSGFQPMPFKQYWFIGTIFANVHFD